VLDKLAALQMLVHFPTTDGRTHADPEPLPHLNAAAAGRPTGVVTQPA
jgi:hypothetical protein